MTQINDKNYKEIIHNYLENGFTVIAVSGSKSCENCLETQRNITDYKIDNKSSKLAFVYMDNTVNFALEEPYQMEELNQYPKTTIFTSLSERTFFEGVISIENLKEFENLAKKS